MADFEVTVTSTATASNVGDDPARVVATATTSCIATLSETRADTSASGIASITVVATTVAGQLINGRYRR